MKTVIGREVHVTRRIHYPRILYSAQDVATKYRDRLSSRRVALSEVNFVHTAADWKGKSLGLYEFQSWYRS